MAIQLDKICIRGSKNKNIEKKKKTFVDYSNTLEHRRHPSQDSKLSIFRRFFEEREDIKSISKEIGYSKASIYLRRRKYISSGLIELVNDNKYLPRGKIIFSIIS